MQDQEVALKLSLINGLLNYLSTRPYAEVANVIQAIHEQVAPQIKVPAEAAPADAQVQ